MQLYKSDDVFNKKNGNSIWTRPSRGDNEHYSLILGA
jgi:hypothetical protein